MDRGDEIFVINCISRETEIDNHTHTAAGKRDDVTYHQRSILLFIGRYLFFQLLNMPLQRLQQCLCNPGNLDLFYINYLLR